MALEELKSSSNVPIVDMAAPEHEAAHVLKQAALCHGFFYLINHGIDPSLVDREFEVNRQFFALPVEEKMKIKVNAKNRGYTPMNEQTLDPANQTVPDTKEGYYIGWHTPEDSPLASKPLHGPNVWPEADVAPHFREVQEDYLRAMIGLSSRVVRLLALALDLPADYFAPMFDPPICNLRPLHYSAQKSCVTDGVLGCGAHTDWGMITLLKTDSNPGLQLRLQGGQGVGSAPAAAAAAAAAIAGEGEAGQAERWVDVPPVEGAYIVNLGDMLERWSNGLFKSTMHRVVNITGRERYSVAFFLEPSFDTLVECLPTCCRDRPPLYPPITCGEHMLERYRATSAAFNQNEAAVASS